MKNNTSTLWVYLANHPFAHYDKSLRVGDNGFMVLILGYAGPQGKSTLEQICNECGIDYATYVRGWNRDISIRPMKKRVLVVDFGDRFLTKEQMDAYNGKEKERQVVHITKEQYGELSEAINEQYKEYSE